MSTTNRILGRAARSAWRLRVFALVAAVALGSPGCERKSEAPAGSGEGRPKIGLLPEGAAKPDVIVILVDALRADRLGTYGHDGNLSPTMDSVAAEGLTFNYCVAPAPWTLPSVATLFTSYYARVHGAVSYRVVADMEDGRRAEQSVLSDRFDTLAEVLQAVGYQTAGFVAAKFLRAGYGFDQGFDHYDTSFAENTVRGELVNAALFDWLDEDRDASKPLFLYLHYMDVHGPYNAAPRFTDPLMEQLEANPNKQLLSSREFAELRPYLKQPPPDASDPGRYERLKAYREYWIARYEAGVAEMDFYLGQLIEGLKQRGLWDQAYVILMADHGEALCEHGLWGHGYSQYQTDLHVPLILRWPGVLPAGKRIRRLASLIDVMPTLLEQLRLPSGENLQGVSLVDHISETLPDAPLLRFAEAVKSGADQAAVFADSTKLMVTALPSHPLPDGTMSRATVRQQLFNLATDPGEQYDVSGQYAAQVRQLTQLLNAMIRTSLTTKPGLVVPKKPVADETVEQLKAIGYVGTTEDANEAEEVPQPATRPASAPVDDSAEGEDEPNDDNP